MKYRKAGSTDAQQIWQLVQNTIKTSYPKYYPQGIVDFFCELHSIESIEADIEKEAVRVLTDDNSIVGTGSFEDNHITRIYVAPDSQGKGYGTYIMEQLEKELARNYNSVVLEASLAASCFYENRGYKTFKHEQFSTNDSILVYDLMEKKL